MPKGADAKRGIGSVIKSESRTVVGSLRAASVGSFGVQPARLVYRMVCPPRLFAIGDYSLPDRSLRVKCRCPTRSGCCHIPRAVARSARACAVAQSRTETSTLTRRVHSHYATTACGVGRRASRPYVPRTRARPVDHRGIEPRDVQLARPNRTPVPSPLLRCRDAVSCLIGMRALLVP